MKVPTRIDVHKIVNKDTFDSEEDGDLLDQALYDSLKNTGYALVNFNGIKRATKEAVYRAMLNFTKERYSCRILVVHTAAEDESVCAHTFLNKMSFKMAK